MFNTTLRVFTKKEPAGVNLSTGVCMSLQNCRPDLHSNHGDRPQCYGPVLLLHTGSVLTQSSSTGEVPKEYVQQVRVSSLKISTTGLPIPHIHGTHHPDNTSLGWGQRRPLYLCVTLTSMINAICFSTFLSELKNCHSFSFLVVPTILSHAVLAH